MAETAIQIFPDITAGKLVKSQKGGPYTLKDSFHQDRLYLKIQPLLVNPTGTDSSPYEISDAANYSITALVVKRSDGSTLAGPVTSWTPDGTAAVGVIELNTAAMATAFTSGSTTSVEAKIEFQLLGATGRTTVQQDFIIRRAYIVSGTPAELPITEYVTQAQFAAQAVKYNGNPDGATITLGNGSYEVILGCGVNGEFTADAGS